jgi:hypothetical protein
VKRNVREQEVLLMSTFLAVDDRLLAERISSVSRRIVFVAPAVSKQVATALGGCIRKADRISITLVLDPDEDAHRLGYGDREGLEDWHRITTLDCVLIRACVSVSFSPTMRS